jgi:hypothetical protein
MDQKKVYTLQAMPISHEEVREDVDNQTWDQGSGPEDDSPDRKSKKGDDLVDYSQDEL